VKLIVQSAGVAHGFTAGIASPKGCGCGLAVGAGCARPFGRTLQRLQGL